MPEKARPICNYEGSAYRTEFWGQDRVYEDAVEREALRQLLPPVGRRLVEIGSGYGRLAPMYDGYDEVVWFDYALSQLRQAQDLWGESGPGGRPRYTYVAGDFYKLPFGKGSFDTVTMIRSIHHAADPAAVLGALGRTLVADGVFVLEFPNKRNIKAISRYLIRRQSWSPFQRDPVEFVPLNFDFHPRWMRGAVSDVGFRVLASRAVSYFRLELLKKHLPVSLLVAMDRLLQPTAALMSLSPSIFLQCAAPPQAPHSMTLDIFQCTECGSTELEEWAEAVICQACGARFALIDGIYDFRAPSGA